MCRRGCIGKNRQKPSNQKNQTDREKMIAYLKEAYPKGAVDQLGRIIGVEVKHDTYNGLF